MSCTFAQDYQMNLTDYRQTGSHKITKQMGFEIDANHMRPGDAILCKKKKSWMKLLICLSIIPSYDQQTVAFQQHTHYVCRLWHRRCLQVSTRESAYSFPTRHHTLCREQIRAVTWGVCLGVCILFFSPETASGQIRAWIRREALSISSRIALSAVFSGSENQTTKLASDRKISQREKRLFFLVVHLPEEKPMSSRKP